MMSLEYHPHNHTSTTSTLYPCKLHPNKERLYTGCHNLGKFHPELVSLNEPGNEVIPGIVLRTGAHQRSLVTRLALDLYSTLVLTRGAWERRKPRDCTLYWCSQGEPGNEASPGIVLCIGAHQGSLGTRLAQGLHTPHWFSPGEPGMRLAQGLYSVLVLTRAAWERG